MLLKRNIGYNKGTHMYYTKDNTHICEYCEHWNLISADYFNEDSECGLKDTPPGEILNECLFFKQDDYDFTVNMVVIIFLIILIGTQLLLFI